MPMAYSLRAAGYHAQERSANTALTMLQALSGCTFLKMAPNVSLSFAFRIGKFILFGEKFVIGVNSNSKLCL
jgi:hypothetical protein